MSRGASRRRSYGPRQRELKRRARPSIDVQADPETPMRLDHGADGPFAAGRPGIAGERPTGDMA